MLDYLRLFNQVFRFFSSFFELNREGPPEEISLRNAAVWLDLLLLIIHVMGTL